MTRIAVSTQLYADVKLEQLWAMLEKHMRKGRAQIRR